MKILTIAILTCMSCIAQAQQSPIPVFQSEHLPTPFINAEGITVFIIPKGHEPVTHLTSLFRKPPIYKSLEAFPSSICIVRGPGHNFYWIDRSGKVVKDFGSTYFRMSPFVDGFAISMKSDQNRDQIFNFLSTNGIPLHASGFKEAHPFSEGLAACKTLNDDFVYIDKTGKVVINPFKGMDVKFATLGQFINGLALIKAHIGNAYQDYFIDKKGKSVINLNSIFPGRSINHAGNFFDTMAGVLLEGEYGVGQDLAFIDKMGTVKLKYPKVVGFNDFVGGVACVRREVTTEEKTIATRTTLIDTLGREIKLQTKKPYEYITTIAPNYIFAAAFDDTQKIHIFSRANNSFIYETEGEIAGMTGDFMLTSIGDYDPVHHIIKLPGKVVWAPSPENVVYDNLSEALKVKDQVRHLNLGSIETLTATVYTLTKLENLELSYQDIGALPPGISKLTNLERLSIFRLEKLTALPTELAQLKKLQTIEINDCPRLKNLEVLIEKCPSLKKVYTNNYTFKPGFIQNMKKLRPNLIIEATSTIELGEFPVK